MEDYFESPQECRDFEKFIDKATQNIVGYFC